MSPNLDPVRFANCELRTRSDFTELHSNSPAVRSDAPLIGAPELPNLTPEPTGPVGVHGCAPVNAAGRSEPRARLLGRMKQAKPRVPNAGSWKAGQSGNPKGGKPRAGLALATRIRERLSPDDIIDLGEAALGDETIPLERRIQLALQLAQLGYQRPTTSLEVTNGAPSATFDHLTLDEQRAMRDELDAVIARYAKPADELASSSEPRLPEPPVTDDDAT